VPGQATLTWRTFFCGSNGGPSENISCLAGKEFCDQDTNYYAAAPTYSCTPLPYPCLDDVSCGCIQESLPNPPPCTEECATQPWEITSCTDGTADDGAVQVVSTSG
jgi:hypothetical protein